MKAKKCLESYSKAFSLCFLEFVALKTIQQLGIQIYKKRLFYEKFFLSKKRFAYG